MWAVKPVNGKMNAERRRLAECTARPPAWKKWGPYLSERQWGTVREDYSPHGTAWEYFPHDHARSRAYRWGEDGGIGGFSDDQQTPVPVACAVERTRSDLEGAPLRPHEFRGESRRRCEELYYYLDATPSHSYLKMLYKYPHAAFPYADLVHEIAAAVR